MPLRSAAALLLLALLALSASAAGPGDDVIAGFRETARAQKESGLRARSAVGDYDRHVAELNSAFDRVPADARDRKWVALKLRHMAEVDGYEREFNVQTPGSLNLTDAEKDEFRMQIGRRAKAIDEANRADLKELLKIHPWFKISEFGAQADKDAWYLVQHADADPDFQKAVLDVLGRLVSTKETDPKNYAFLYDRVAISYDHPERRKPQRYGTQGECLGPKNWQLILPVEEIRRLDERRKEVGLGPEAEYKKLIEEHLCR